MDIAERARLSFAQGWVESGGPMTDRVKAGCVAAVALAAAHADDPDILEATLQLGKLEGHWAAIFADREALHRDHGAAMTAAYRALCRAALDVPTAVARFRRALVSGSHADNRAAATATAVQLVHQAADTSRPEYRAAVDTIRDALQAGRDTGRAAGELLAGHREADGGSDRDDDAAGVAALGSFIRGNTSDVGDTLTRLADDDATEQDMISAVEAGTFGDAEAASGLYGDQAMSQAFGAGLLGAFAAAGLAQVSWVTAGGGRVCQRCYDLEAGSPYLLITAPRLGAHPRCRCILVPA